ncbi:hypothetical protein F2Q69_00028858 [Brassica cretica]|uniref:Uncharacterized protein n=1 Tax=Brassica cretica TaxID=69181 RepID=A0A8S9S674_BRACR|nr:hypothetical protein F2Q69_00028858 [Brassica cretica]
MVSFVKWRSIGTVPGDDLSPVMICRSVRWPAVDRCLLQARTTRAEVTSPIGEDDSRRGHLTHGQGPTSRPETVHPRLSSLNTILRPLDAIPMSSLA